MPSLCVWHEGGQGLHTEPAPEKTRELQTQSPFLGPRSHPAHLSLCPAGPTGPQQDTAPGLLHSGVPNQRKEPLHPLPHMPAVSESAQATWPKPTSLHAFLRHCCGDDQELSIALRVSAGLKPVQREGKEGRGEGRWREEREGGERGLKRKGEEKRGVERECGREREKGEGDKVGKGEGGRAQASER